MSFTRRRCPQQTLNRCSMFTLLGNGFCRDRVCNSVVCSHSWTTTDLCTDNTTHCDSLCSAATDCRAYSVATQPPPTHPGACHTLGKARCILYSGTAYAAGLFSQPSYQCYAKSQPPQPPVSPPLPSPPPVSPSPSPSPPPQTLQLVGAGPWAIPLFGAIGSTSSAGTEPAASGGLVHAAGEPIFGPFTVAISDARGHGSLLRSLGCPPGRGSVPAGVDMRTAERILSHQCNVTLPRIGSNGARIGLLTDCGGLLHTSLSGASETRFYERLDCVNPGRDTNGHSLMVGSAYDGKAIYGRWEGIRPPSSDLLPSLDVCGGHFGLVPGAASSAYHYHISDGPPFTLGCFSAGRAVTLSECRALYPDACGDAPPTPIVTNPGGVRTTYDLFCPCFDGRNGSNVGAYIPPVVTSDAEEGDPWYDAAAKSIFSYFMISFAGCCVLTQCCCVWWMRRRKLKALQAAAGERVAPAARVAPNELAAAANAAYFGGGGSSSSSTTRPSTNQEQQEPPATRGRFSAPMPTLRPLTLAELEGKSVKELRALARERRVDTSGCVERSDLVESLMAGPGEA